MVREQIGTEHEDFTSAHNRGEAELDRINQIINKTAKTIKLSIRTIPTGNLTATQT